MLLWLLIPHIERGKNGKASYSRRFYRLYSVYDTITFEDIFTENNNGYCYLTIKGAAQLAHLAKIGKIGVIAENLDIDDSDLNFGINGENTVELNINGFIKATKTEDKNGIDGYFFEYPVQIKSAVHGCSEYVANVLDGMNKKRGISVINASIKDLYRIVNS